MRSRSEILPWQRDHGFKSKITLCAILLGGTFGTNVVFADTANGEAGETGPLQEIVVTATRHEEGLSKVPISVTALTQEAIDDRGIKDIMDVARFTPGINVDNSGTNNISIRGIASSGGAGTTGIYIDDTPIQMRALAFNPDEALPKSFDIDRVEVLRGPQGTLFGAGSEGGTVRYITAQPSLTQSSVYSRDEVSYTQGGAPSYEAGIAAGAPLIDDVLGARITVWYRRDGGYINSINPVTLAQTGTNTNYDETALVRVALVWAVSDSIKVTPSFYYQDRYRNNVENYWPIYSNPSSNDYVNADPTRRSDPDLFWLPALKIEGDLGFAQLVSNTSFYHRKEETGYEGTLYNLGFYQSEVFGASSLGANYPLLDGNGIHLPAGATNYTSPASVDNGQQNFAQEVRLQSKDTGAPLTWTAGMFFGLNKQTYLEQIHDPLLNELSVVATGAPYTDYFVDPNGNPVEYDPRFPGDSYFLETQSEDKQIAWFGEGSYSFTDQWKATVGARYSMTKFSFNTLTGGPQLYLQPQTGNGDQKQDSFTPKFALSYQMDPNNLYYATYAKGFRPGGANNPVPAAACATDFTNFGINEAPQTYKSDTVNSFEVGAKNNFDNRVKIASSIYYIRWNNIQQTVVPPICQISFIDNLGKAVAKGADIQGEIALTDNFTAEISAGYTDARYTQDSKLTPLESMPVVAKGDAIEGQSDQPAPPVTASIGLEYKFELMTHESFLRVDDEYEGRPKWAGATQDANTLQYDSAFYTLSHTNFASGRAGISFGEFKVEAFCDNLLDTHTVTNYDFSIDPGDGTSRLQRQYTFRPRTMGLTFLYRLK